ncbi:hypothetical protein AB1K70_15440 [Bremerella sp. JC770]|uniref:hypothetical protein n=1 Tax=Bremerella sp. JC770 TaxID=3232137 RepID=UPI00345913CE
MSHHHAQPESSGSRSPEHAPQVVVRAGKTYLCSACGTLVEIPADVVGRMVVVVDPPSPSTSDKPLPATDAPTPKAPPEAQPSGTPSPAWVKRPTTIAFTGETIDGLRVPTSTQLDRALAWVSFHLKVLDRRASEHQRLQKQLKARQLRPSHAVVVEEAVVQASAGLAVDATSSFTSGNVNEVPGAENRKQRGPP